MSSLIEAFFPPRLPPLYAVRRRLETQLPSDVASAALTHLADPAQPAAEIADRLPGRLRAVRRAYAHCRSDPEILTLVASAHYPHRLRWQAAAATVAEWTEEPARPARLLAGDAVISRTVELHPSKGSCNYSCAMCLWSDKKELTYATKDLQAEGLVSTSDWLRILDELHRGGVRTVVFSGGGEVLLNKDVAPVMAHAQALGLDTHLYTTGFNITPDNPLWRQLTNLGRIRFSIHSPDAATYDQLVRLPARLRALQRVTANIRALLADRERTGNGPRVGIGFVLQPLNYRQLLDMAAYASEVGVDFLHLRKDEVDVTDGLTTDQLRDVAEQLRRIRATFETGGYAPTTVDLGDELVAIANEQPITRRRTPECLAKAFRPTISPYGLLAPCDLKAEPRFAASEFNLGQVRGGRTLPLLADAAQRHIPDTCKQCMPSSRTGNAVYHKLLADLRAGLGLHEQPFQPL